MNSNQLPTGLLKAGSDAVIIVPPFAAFDRPSLAVHILQACAEAKNCRVSVLYANLSFAGLIGEQAYAQIAYAPTMALLGERLFAAHAYGVTPLGHRHQNDFDRIQKGLDGKYCDLSMDDLMAYEQKIGPWLTDVARLVIASKCRVAGCTTTFEQTAAGMALLNTIKSQAPDMVTIMGGANCEGGMGQGLARHNHRIDYVFSGECETVFPEFLRGLKTGIRPEGKIVEGSFHPDMDALPPPHYGEYYRQRDVFLKGDGPSADDNVWLPYETSRGCWWGQKNPCTFCGINGSNRRYRAKSPEKIFSELRELLARHPSNKVCMIDNVMPRHFMKTFIPKVADRLGPLCIFYEQRSDLSHDDIKALKAAGVAIIQPGIEALSDPLLELMNKGVTLQQNLNLLRYSRSVDLFVNWNILYGFPGDDIAWYQRTARILPLIHHLPPPTCVARLSIDRFSEYFENPNQYHITHIRPMDGYGSVLPPDMNPSEVAYHFSADYRSDSLENPEVIEGIMAEVERWQSDWLPGKVPPTLGITPLDDDHFLLLDTRNIDDRENHAISFLNKDQVGLLLGRTHESSEKDVQWAIQRGLVIADNGGLKSIVCADMNLINMVLK